jgi:hypothetical protein
MGKRIDKTKNKKGQFYLLASIIIVALIMGLAVETNRATKVGIDKTKAYELFVDVNVDTIKMVNYAPESAAGYSPDELKNILNQFNEIHSSVKIIYIVINREGTNYYHKYENEELNVLEDGTEKQEIISYSPGFSNYYEWIIREKNDNRYVILRLKG